eukprot:TRINITY_DN21106_c0_g5_i2.p2 TRINITY_DN21106_c0_g5~~TRINITY_DN21106_c0_g5_i2.p2  ORF type:complete len:132 (-),score=17.09 TRINITY_DN21106_c0_g5_i2:96-491(-)
MEAFGEVTSCHMGNRGTDLPLVRFRTQSSSEAAIVALKAGNVFLDGIALSGDWKGSGGSARPPPAPDRGAPRIASRDEAKMELTSRDLFQRKGAAARSRSRSRSRDRRRKRRSRTRSRSRSRSRSRRRRRD